MVATSAHHIVRVTVRVSVVAFHRDIDVTLPTSSTLAEVLPELARLVELPEVHRPWEATTAAGAPLDMHTPLYGLKLYDGAIVVLRPEEPVPPPVVRDAADALVHAAQSAREVRGLDAAATWAGVAALAAVAWKFLHPAAALALAAGCALAAAAAARSRPVFAPAPLIAGAAAGVWVSGGEDPALGAVAAALTAVVVAGLGAALGLAGAVTVAFVGTVSALGACGAAGAWLPGPLAPAALVALGGVLTVMATPGAATRLAGLTVPRVPTAGEEFDRSDTYQADVDARSAAAASIAAAISLAAAACTIPALGCLACSGGGWVAAFCLAMAGALVVYASRHHWAVPRASLTAAGLAAVVAAAVAAPAHPVWVCAVGLVALAAASAVAWAPRVPDLEPTTVVWFERAEVAAIIAVIPLAVQLTGLFDLIRGL